MASITSGVFFSTGCARRRAVGSGRPPHPDSSNWWRPGRWCADRAQKSGQHAVAAVAEFHGFQAGIQAALLLVQKTVEQDDGGFISSGDTSKRLASITVGTTGCYDVSAICRWWIAGSVAV